MKTIFNIIKFNLKAQKTLFIIEICIILFFTMIGLKTSFFNIGISKGLTSILPTVSIIIVVNFIVSIVKFSMQLSIEEGKLLHLVPMKGWQFMLAKYLEFIVVQLTILILGVVSCIILQGGAFEVFLTGFSEIFGLLIAYIMITAFIIITASYFEKTWICVITTILACLLYNFILFIVDFMLLSTLPTITLVINDSIRIGIFDTLLSGIFFIGLLVLSTYHFDKKLDIV